MAHRTIASLIDDVTKRLGDQATVISRDEIRDALADGYARMIRDARTPRRIEAHDVPPRAEYAVTYEWERKYVAGVTRKFTYTHYSGRYECTYPYEVSQRSGEAATTWQWNVTHLHQLAHISSQTDSPYTFSIPRRHDLLGLWYDHEPLKPVSGRSLESGRNWWDNAGEPILFTTDYSHNVFDIYRIVTSNNAGYNVDRPIGAPRRLSGARTYTTDGLEVWGYGYTSLSGRSGLELPFTGPGRKVPGELTSDGYWKVQDAYTYPWERKYAAAAGINDDSVDLSMGIPRSIKSPDRQYWNTVSWIRHGVIRAWNSSDDNLFAYIALTPEREISEGAMLDMIPSQLEKYIVYYALAEAFGHEGELYDPNMAEHYRLRYSRGVFILSRIHNLGFRDATYSRDVTPRRGIRMPQLPDQYPVLKVR